MSPVTVRPSQLTIVQTRHRRNSKCKIAGMGRPHSDGNETTAHVLATYTDTYTDLLRSLARHQAEVLGRACEFLRVVRLSELRSYQNPIQETKSFA